MIYREEVTAMLFMIADIDVRLGTIIGLLREENGEEEEEDPDA